MFEALIFTAVGVVWGIAGFVLGFTRGYKQGSQSFIDGITDLLDQVAETIGAAEAEALKEVEKRDAGARGEN